MMLVDQTSTVALTETVLPTANVSSNSESVSDDETIIYIQWLAMYSRLLLTYICT